MNENDYGGGSASRRELDQVREDLRGQWQELRRRLDEIDLHGTRGVGVVDQKLLDLTSDVAELRTEFRQAQRDRASNRRWLITIGCAMAGVTVAVLTLLVGVLQHRLH